MQLYIHVLGKKGMHIRFANSADPDLLLLQEQCDQGHWQVVQTQIRLLLLEVG